MTVLTQKEAKKYFSPGPFAQVAAVSILIAFYLFYENYTEFGILLLLIGAAFLFLNSRKQSAEADQDIEDTFESLVPVKELEALKALNMSKDQLVRKSDWFWCAPPAKYLKTSKVGKDKITRYPTRTLLLILYGDKQIMTSETICDITTDIQSSTINSEWFYRDVVAVEVGVHENNSNLILKSAAGDKYFQLENQKSKIKLDSEKTNSVIASIRSILREKKS